MIRHSTLFIGTLVLLVVIGIAEGQSGNGYTLTRSTTVPGGTSTGYGYTLSGAIGQHDAGTLSNDVYELRGGFWPTPSGFPGLIPTVSAWGLIVMTLLLLTGMKISFARRRAAKA